MLDTAPSDKQPNSRTSLYLSIICTYLVLIVCVQFALIITLKNETEVVISNIPRESSDCGSIHTIVKRQINRGLQLCPPGCVRRRRKRPFGAIARPESTVHPYSDHFRSGWTGESGQSGWPGESGRPGWPGESGHPGLPGESGRPGESGQPGWPGESGQPGWPGENGQPGLPGESGQAGWPGESGQIGHAGEPGASGGRGQQGVPGPRGGQGSSGRSGLPGSPGATGGAGYPGIPGLPGGRGLPGQRGEPGGYGNRGQQGVLGPAGDRGQPGHERVLGSGNSYNYETDLGPSLRSGLSRGDQRPTEHPYYSATAAKNITSASSLLKEFRLYPHPECKDEVNHRALMDTLKDKGKVSFMILVDLQDNEYCIVHS